MRDGVAESPQLLSLGGVNTLSGALQTIANHLAGLAQPKNLVWLSTAFPNPFHPAKNPSGGTDTVRELYRLQMLHSVNKLMSSNVAIYPVDARGLTTDPRFDAANQVIGIHPTKRGEAQNSLLPHDFSALEELAKQSGGKAYYNTNGLAQCIDEASAAGAGRYTLTFYAPDTRPDGKFHTIKVVSKRPQIQLQYRSGYWDISAPASNSELSGEVLKAALESPLNATAIGVKTDAAISVRSQHIFTVTALVNPNDLELHRHNGAWTGQFSYVFGQKDSADRVFAIPPYQQIVRIDDRVYQQMLSSWISVRVSLAIRPQSKVLRMAVRDDLSGNVGSTDIELQKPPNAPMRQ